MAYRNSLLWKVESPKGKASYLLGTMHVKNDVAYSLVEEVRPLILKTDMYIAELDLGDSRLNDISDHLTMENSLKDLLSEKRYRKYARIIHKSFGIDIGYYDYYKPLILTNIIAESVLSASYEVPLDQYLWQFALVNKRKMFGLESATDQFRTLEKIPMDTQLKGFIDMAKNVTNFRKQILQLNAAYESQDLKKLYKLSKKSMGSLRKLMIYDRNQKMTKRLINYLEEDTAFCAVGAAHLPGSKGMLRLLKQSGFRIKPCY